MISICGAICNECKEYKTTCKGCNEMKGKVYWAPFVGADTCPMYDCCIQKKSLPHCGKCSQLPCKLYYDTQDPSVNYEEHKKGIMKRTKILKKLS